MFSNLGEKQECERRKQLQLKVCYPTGAAEEGSAERAPESKGACKQTGGACGELSPKPRAQCLGYKDRKVVYANKEPALTQLKGRGDFY